MAHKGIYLIEWLFRSQSYWGTVLMFVGSLRSYSVSDLVALAETWTTTSILGGAIQFRRHHSFDLLAFKRVWTFHFALHNLLGFLICGFQIPKGRPG